MTAAETGLQYHPFPSGARDGVTEMVGEDASYRNGALVELLVSPALSVQVPATVAAVASGPAYVVPVHETPPETEVPLTVAPTGAVYHPLGSGPRAVVTETLGPEASYWKVGLVPLVLALTVAVPVSGPA